MASSASSSIPKKASKLKDLSGAAVYEYKSKYIAKYVRNNLLSRKQTLLYIVSNFHT